VDGFGTYNVHFIHQRSDVPNAIPLIFLHGWPGSFIEVTKILPELVQGGQNFPAFHVVAPSLIDYGFSQGNTKVSSFYVWHLFQGLQPKITQGRIQPRSTRRSIPQADAKSWIFRIW
jgi:pimeloyl-ACP methyl ester carboxylesterase